MNRGWGGGLLFLFRGNRGRAQKLDVVYAQTWEVLTLKTVSSHLNPVVMGFYYVNLFDFMFLLVLYSKVLCSSASFSTVSHNSALADLVRRNPGNIFNFLTTFSGH